MSHHHDVINRRILEGVQKSRFGMYSDLIFTKFSTQIFTFVLEMNPIRNNYYEFRKLSNEKLIKRVILVRRFKSEKIHQKMWDYTALIISTFYPHKHYQYDSIETNFQSNTHF